ncbi:MAG: DUF6125 family protein [Firmicutes bacterium]|nr:DUF6125 family protein [Bacillota bacterium]
MKELDELSREEIKDLLSDAAKNWLAHDGLWFQAAEKEFGLETAIRLDAEVWSKFSPIEAERIMKRLNIMPGGGIPSLIQALKFRLYARINIQEIVEVSENRCVFRMKTCRVQESRKRKGLADFPCKPVGLVEYETFAKTIDARIKTKCIACPPDPHPEEYWCAWEFFIEEV